MVKAVILDFDGTLVNNDILDVLCSIVGKENESKKINEEFYAGKCDGLSSLITRINFLRGVSLSQIETKLSEEPYVMKGAQNLLTFLNNHRLITILSSGNIVPVLLYYQKLLGFTYIVGSIPKMDSDIILGIDENGLNHKNRKITQVTKILEKLSISRKDTLAIGDSPADRKIFEFANISIAINPKEGIEKSVDYVIKDDLSNAIPIINKYL